MAWAAVSGSGASTAGGTFSTTTMAAPAASAGDVIVFAVATDNVALADGESSDHLYIWDDIVNTSNGNLYTKLGEYTIAGGGADLGVTVSLWVVVVRQALTTSNIITFTFSPVSDFVCVYERFTKASTYLTMLGKDQRVDSGADPGSLTVGSLASAEHLFLRASAHEGPSSDTYTASASYAKQSGGVTAISVALEWRILTATTDSTDPSWSGAATDHASIMVALDESASDGTIAGDPTLTVQIDIEGV